MSGRRLVEPIIMLAIAEATELVVFAGVHGPARVILGATFALIVPGWALIRLIHLEALPLTWLAFAVAISTAIDIVVALPLLYFGIWSIQLAVTLLVGIVVVLVAIDLPIVRGRLKAIAMATYVELNRRLSP